MAGRRRAWYAIAVTTIALSFFVYLLPKHWSPREYTNLGVAASGGVHAVSPESQPTPQTSRQPSPGQPPRRALSDSKGRATNKTRPSTLYHRDKTALERDTHIQPRQMLRDQTSLIPLQNGSIRPPRPLAIGLQNEKDRLRQQSVKMKPKLLVCNPGKTNTTALGFQPLSQSVVEGVEKFVFFVGYQRSAHSIIGSVMDAHPDIVIAHEYFLFSECASQLKVGASIFKNKTQLFNELYKNSYLSSKCGWRSDSNTSKGYNLDIGDQWQGKFHQLRVIGDKSGGSATKFMQSDKGNKCLDQMVDSLNMSIIAVHVVRNPYDMIATNILYQLSVVKATKASDIMHRKVRPDITVLLLNTKRLFSQALAVKAVSKKVTVVEIHIEDYIKDPRSCVLEICNALEVPCPQDYVEECYQKAYRNISRSRDLIEWEPVILRRIQEKMKEFPFFRGYTFEDDFRL